MIETKIINGLKLVYNHNRNLVNATLSDNKVQELKKFLKSNPEAIVVIHPNNWMDFKFNVHNFEVLNDLEEVRKVILTIEQKLESYSGLYYLKNLEELDAWLASSIDIDFSRFRKLKKISFYWTPETKYFFDCKSLKIVRVWKYKSKDRNLKDFGSLNNVQQLGIIQSNIKSIIGVEQLNKLKRLELSYNLSLEIDCNKPDIIMPDIEELEINSCKNVGFDFIKIFPNVKKLTLEKFQDIAALKPILDGLPKLEQLFIGETKILETDNSYYLKYPHIKEFYFDERKYHKLKNKDLKQNS